MGKWNIYYTYSNKNLFGADKISNLILSTNLSKMCDTKDEENSLESSDICIMFNIYYLWVFYCLRPLFSGGGSPVIYLAVLVRDQSLLSGMYI